MSDVLVVLPGDDASLAVRWVRHLRRYVPEAPIRVDGPAADDFRLADLPPPTGAPRIEVRIDAGQPPPPWRWLPQLLATLERTGADAAQPVLVHDDLTVSGPAGAGLPTSAVEVLDGVTLPSTLPGAIARRVGSQGDAVLAADSWLVRDDAPHLLDLPAPGPAPASVRGRSLRWAIDIAAPAAPLGRRWGDWHFARSLADALERLGQRVLIDHPQTRGRATRAEDDVVLVLRGLERVDPVPGAVNLLWVISHPDDVGDDEPTGFDAAFAAGTTWAAAHGVEALLQCTDATRFRPAPTSTETSTEPSTEPSTEILFVGNARGGPRPVVVAAREAGLDVTVIGDHWEAHGVPVAARQIANADLPARYAAAGVVLNDHHADMREQGFVSNRVFDVLAVGGRLLTDDVAGLPELGLALGSGPIPVWHDAADLARLAVPPFAAWPSAEQRRRLAERVVAEHSFDARASTLLDRAVRLVDSRG